MDPDTNEWYYLALGCVVTEYTDATISDVAFIHVRNGKLASDYNRTVKYY